MSQTPAIEMRRLEAENHPSYESVIAKANEFAARRGLNTAQFAELVGCATVTMHIYLRGDYRKATQRGTTRYMDARVWSYITRHWPRQSASPSEDLIETRAYKKILGCVEDAVESGAISLIYGPPSSEKSFVAENIVAQYQAAGRRDLIRVLCGPQMSPLSILRYVAREAEVWARGNSRFPFVQALANEFSARERPPAIIVDEAQNLTVSGLETLRIDLHERLRRGGAKGCGLVFLGSHNLYSIFENFASRYSQEQLLSRISYRVQLKGMTDDEVLAIGARALGANGKSAKLSDTQKQRLLEACRVVDPYATGEDGERLKDAAGKAVVATYYSSRRLLEYVRQKRRANVNAILAEEVA